VPSELTNDFKVGEFIANRSLNVLVREASTTSIEPKVMEVLYYLAARQNQVITRQELMDNLWQSQVSDGAVSRVVGLLRKALGDNSESPEYIQTVAKKGYCLIAEVESIAAETQSSKSLTANSSTNKLTLAITTLIAITLAFIIAFNWSQEKQSTSPSLINNQPQFSQLTSEQGFEFDANLSFDDKWLIYRHRKSTQEQYNLYLKNLDDQRVTQLTSSVKDDRAPTFSPNKKQ